MFPDGDCLGREYLAEDSLDLGTHGGDVGYHDGDAVSTSQFLLCPKSADGDLVSFVDGLYQLGCFEG